MSAPPPAGVTSAPLPLAADLGARARAILPWMTEIRRDLHRHPELGLEEHRTSRRIQEWLAEIGIPFRAGLAGTGVLGLLGRPGAARAVALRADIDALPLHDAKDVPYRATAPGRMHACGHDVHTAVLFGAARLLAELGDDLPGLVKLIFQPAEETVGGAKLLIEEGVLREPPVAAIFGLHVDPSIEVGGVGLRYGQRNASSDTITLHVHGTSCHGAYPAAGIDAIVVAAQVVSAVQSVVSRNVDARRAAVITFGIIHGGTQGNIVANHVELVGTVRSLDSETRGRVLERLREVAEGVATGMGGRAELVVEAGYDALINDDAMVEVVKANAEALLGHGTVTVYPQANMGVEDFAYYLAHAPGAFYSLGVRNQARGIVHPVHNENFDVDEDCLAVGAALQAMNALSVLRA